MNVHVRFNISGYAKLPDVTNFYDDGDDAEEYE